jgi:hypothetical protein
MDEQVTSDRGQTEPRKIIPAKDLGDQRHRHDICPGMFLMTRLYGEKSYELRAKKGCEDPYCVVD